MDESTDIHELLEELKVELRETRQDIKKLTEDVSKVTARLDLRLEQLESTVFDMRTEKDVLDSEVRALKEENKELRNRVEQCVKEDSALKKSLNDQEQHGRGFNLRVYGVAEGRGGKETVDDCVGRCADIFTTKVGVTVSKQDIEIAHRTGRPGGTRPRPIIVRFQSRRLRGTVLADRRKLKQSGVSIGEDLTQLNYKLLRRASQHSATLAAWSSNGKTLVKLKNGKTVKLEIDMNVENVLSKEMV